MHVEEVFEFTIVLFRHAIKNLPTVVNFFPTMACFLKAPGIHVTVLGPASIVTVAAAFIVTLLLVLIFT